MSKKLELSDRVHERIYVSWPEDTRPFVEDGLNQIVSIDPHQAKIAPSPPYPLNSGHVHIFKFEYEDQFQYVTAHFVYSDDLDSCFVDHISASPGFSKRVPIYLSKELQGEVVEIPQRSAGANNED